MVMQNKFVFLSIYEVIVTICDWISENGSKSHMKSSVFQHVFNYISNYVYVFIAQF